MAHASALYGWNINKTLESILESVIINRPDYVKIKGQQAFISAAPLIGVLHMCLVKKILNLVMTK